MEANFLSPRPTCPCRSRRASNGMNDCVFCKIIAGEIPAHKVYEDDSVLGFLDITPVTKGHTLVVPKKHFRNIFDTPEEILCHIIKIAKKISAGIKEAGLADGINIGINNESPAGQVVFHTHIHITPRFEGDGLELWHGHKPDYSLAEIAEKIKKTLV